MGNLKEDEHRESFDGETGEKKEWGSERERERERDSMQQENNDEVRAKAMASDAQILNSDSDKFPPPPPPKVREEGCSLHLTTMHSPRMQMHHQQVYLLLHQVLCQMFH